MLEVMVIPGTQLDWLVPRDERTVVLADGARAVVRRLASGEAKVVQEVFDGMSERSRYQRFAGAKPALSSRDLEVLTTIDHDNHEAFVAVDPRSGRAVGEAHIVRDDHDRAVADVAFAVADDWQGRCLGSRLADILAKRARQLGIGRLRATMLADNSRSLALIQRMGRVAARRYDGGGLELEVVLD
jgi:RimJ/RimL family protein N-acetyltransferase